MTQPAVIFSNYDGAHTADRAANNTCVAKVKRQTEWQKERSSRSLLPKSFVLGENLWRTTADSDGDSKHCWQSKSKHGTDKKQAKKKRHFFIYFNYFQVFLGFFVLLHCKVLQTRPETQSEPFGFSLGKQQKTFHAETWQSTANLTWTLPNRFHHGQKQQDEKTQSCLRICCCEWSPKRSTSAAPPVSRAWPCHISCHAWPGPLAYDS